MTRATPETISHAMLEAPKPIIPSGSIRNLLPDWTRPVTGQFVTSVQELSQTLREEHRAVVAPSIPTALFVDFSSGRSNPDRNQGMLSGSPRNQSGSRESNNGNTRSSGSRKEKKDGKKGWKQRKFPKK